MTTCLLRPGVDFLYGCPQMGMCVFESLQEYLAYSEGEEDYLYVDPKFRHVKIEDFSEYVSWYLS
jgi:hypothetical protein